MDLGKLKEYPKNKTILITTLISSIPFIILTLYFIINEFRLISTTGFGVLNFELAWTPNMINNIFIAWGSEEMKRQIVTHYIDYIYIPFYGVFGAECILLVTRKLAGTIQKFGLYITLTPFIAGIFDALENINLLLMLTDESFIHNASPFLASLCAIFKISFLVMGLCFMFIAINILIFRENHKLRYLSFTLGAILIFWLLSIWNVFLALLVGAIYISILIYTLSILKE